MCIGEKRDVGIVSTGIKENVGIVSTSDGKIWKYGQIVKSQYSTYITKLSAQKIPKIMP